MLPIIVAAFCICLVKARAKPPVLPPPVVQNPPKPRVDHQHMFARPSIFAMPFMDVKRKPPP